MKLIVQIPALNESRTIQDVIRAVPREIPGISDIEIVVVDDGSSDETAALAREAGATVLQHTRTRGVGAAFRTGIEYAITRNPDIVVTIDADGQFDAADIPKLLVPIQRGEAEFVTASRFKDPSLTPEMPRLKIWGNHFMARWVSAITGQRFYDVSCGFRAYSRSAYLRLNLIGDFTYTHETFLNLAFSGVRMAEVPIRVRGARPFGHSRVASNLFRYGCRTAAIILRTYRDYRPIRFFAFLALVAFSLGIALAAFLFYVKASTGQFTPHKWAGVTALALFGMGLVLFLVGIVAEMLDRNRAAVQELLYRVRKLEQELISTRRSDTRTTKSAHNVPQF